MADYYSEASFKAVENLTDNEVDWLNDELSVDFAELSEKELEEWMELREMEDISGSWGFDHEIQTDKEGDRFLWIHNDDYFEPSNAAGFLYYFIKAMRPDYTIGFEWSNTCSKPRLNSFGGGAVVIDKNGLGWMNTGEWLETEMRKRLPIKEDK